MYCCFSGQFLSENDMFYFSICYKQRDPIIFSIRVRIKNLCLWLASECGVELELVFRRTVKSITQYNLALDCVKSWIPVCLGRSEVPTVLQGTCTRVHAWGPEMVLACSATPLDLGAGSPAARDGAARLQLRHTQVAVVSKFDTQGNSLRVVTQFRLLPVQLLSSLTLFFFWSPLPSEQLHDLHSHNKLQLDHFFWVDKRNDRRHS